MKKLNLLMAVLAMSALVSFTSCGKKGCTDPDATNYDDEAKKDDGTCEYEGKVVLWYTQKTERAVDSMYNYPELHFYVDEKEISDGFGGAPYIESTPAAPGCGEGGYYGSLLSTNPIAKVDLGTSPSKSVKYRVLTKAGDEVFKGSVTVKANACNQIEMKF